MFQIVHMHGIRIFQEGGHSLVSFGWGGGGLLFQEISVGCFGLRAAQKRWIWGLNLLWAFSI